MTTGILPDGSGFFTGSLPLPKNHWLYAPGAEGWDNLRECSPDLPHPVLEIVHRQAVQDAVRYAIRAATLNGSDMNFDPDALVQNTVIALCGFYLPEEVE